MTWAQVYGALDAWTIPGMTVVNFANVPPRVAAADCPLLFAAPVEFYGSKGVPQGFTTGKGQDEQVIDHMCLWKPLGLGKIQQVMPDLVTAWDNYWAKMTADPALTNGSGGFYLAEKMEMVDKTWPVVSWGGVAYWGFAPRLRLLLRT